MKSTLAAPDPKPQLFSTTVVYAKYTLVGQPSSEPNVDLKSELGYGLTAEYDIQYTYT